MPKQRIGIMRPGSGQLATIIAVAEVDVPGSWDERPEIVDLLVAKALPLGGDLIKAKDAFVEAMGPGYAKALANAGQWGIKWDSKYTPEPLTIVDVTVDPAARDLLPWTGGSWIIRGGRTPAIDAGPDQLIGRMDLLSDMKLRLARKRLRSHLTDEADIRALRTALQEAAAKPLNADVADTGLDLIELSTSEALALTVALLTIRALNVGPKADTKRDYSGLFAVRGA